MDFSEEITATVGPNGSGKTALLQALTKLFGISRSERIIHFSDFHLSPEANPEDRSPRNLFIEVLIGLPELTNNTATSETVAPAFRHMRIDQPGGNPICRMRLEARWEDDGTVEGEVSQELFWVDTLEVEPTEEQKHPVSVSDRGLIQLYYTPANRDASAQIRATTGAIAARLLRAIEWSDATYEAVKNASKILNGAFEAEKAIMLISTSIKNRWSDLHDEAVDTKPGLSLSSRRFEEVVRRFRVIFQNGPDGSERELDTLSDGQQSLFYFALAAAVFDLERMVVTKKIEGFLTNELQIPALTIFAIEEPENHLSPYYLARIVSQIRSLVSNGNAQSLMTSHSPAVLSRVDPSEVRYCRCDPTTRISTIKSVKMPEGEMEAEKFVRSAMLAFPELYFARFVLLVEGDSERIVLPRLAKARNLLVDPSFVAIVPLGGRHVQHFWQLLGDLGIPYATLLDLDLGREGGGFGRVKTIIQRLIKVGVRKEELLLLSDDSLLTDSALASMHKWQNADHIVKLQGWVDSLKPHGVFFSSPLDLDLAMLAAFPEAYMAIIPAGGGPRTTVEKAAEAVFGMAGPGIKLYDGDFASYQEHFPSYRYHFLTHSKPATHLAAMSHLNEKMIHTNMPDFLVTVLEHIEKTVRKD